METTLQINIGLIQSIISLAIILIGFGITFGKIITEIKAIRRELENDIKPQLTKINSKLDQLSTETQENKERLILTEQKNETLWKNQFSLN